MSATPSAPKIGACNVTKIYPSAAGLVTVVDDFRLDVADGEFVCIVGPSGCGKSTFLRSFNRMHDLYAGNRYEGEIRMFPDDVNVLAPTAATAMCG